MFELRHRSRYGFALVFLALAMLLSPPALSQQSQQKVLRVAMHADELEVSMGRTLERIKAAVESR